MIQYGLINQVDASCLQRAIDYIQIDFPNEIINYTEVGIYHGRTTSGIKTYLDSVGAKYNLIGIDNFKDKEELVFFPEEATLIVGSSIEVYNQLPDGSQHLILIDGNHSFPYVIADWFCYSQKVKVGGYMAFHDAAPHAQNKSFQRMGSDKDMDMYISVRKSLGRIGLIGDDASIKNWELIFDEADMADEGGGTIVFKRLF